MKEVWSDIKGYEGYYQVSTLGRVRSLNRTVTHKNGVKVFYKGKVHKQYDEGKYMRVTLNMNSKSYRVRVHRLVAQTFLNKPCYKCVVDHKNNNPKDNRVSNLQWVSYRINNSKDKVNGTSKFTGVSKSHRHKNKWRASLQHKGKTINLGEYLTEEEARDAYLIKSKQLNENT